MREARETPNGAGKFSDRRRTAGGEVRASVLFEGLETLWINTGSLCNLRCERCYMESGPRNRRLAYFSAEDVRKYVDEIDRLDWPTRRVGFTGGEPFMNPEILEMLEVCLGRGFEVLVLTNATRPMARLADALLTLGDRFGDRLRVRVSVDHYTHRLHELERGPGSWEPMVEGLSWLWRNGFSVAVAGRTPWDEDEESLREGYGELFARLGVGIDAEDPTQLVLFPEMNGRADVPEITADCWTRLEVSPPDLMCASSRMVVKRRGESRPSVVACTLLPYEPEFEMGPSLAGAGGEVWLNHPRCARFCALGGGTCVPGS